MSQGPRRAWGDAPCESRRFHERLAAMRWGVTLGCAVAVAAAGIGCGSSTSIVLHGDAGNDTPSAVGGTSGGAGAPGTGGRSSTGGATGTGGAPSSTGGAPGSGGSGAGGAAVVDAGGDTPGIPCGNNFCTGATRCCNPSCGICAPGGALCSPVICGADGGPFDASFSFDALGCSAIPALDTNCGGARPAHYYACVLSTLPAPCTVLNIGNVTNSFCCP